jgi:hypothetical protein
MIALVRGTMVTTTTHGSWLPGDVRGYVERGQILPPQPRLEAYARSQMKGDVVVLSAAEQTMAFDALVAAANEFGYHLSDAVVEATHVHWIIGHDDAVETMVGRLKTRTRQTLRRGRIWTAGYCGRALATLNQLAAAQEYLARHPGARMINGQLVPHAQPPAPPGGRPAGSPSQSQPPGGARG